MKKIILFITVNFFVFQLHAQDASMQSSQEATKEDRNFRIPLIGESAPSFTAESTNGTINFPVDFGRKWKILFSHPQDFTPVCSTEILELASLQEEFDKLGAKLIVVSTDALETHEQWKKAMESLAYKDREAVKIEFPLVDDADLSVSKKYGMIHAATNSTRDVRGVFIISPDNVIKAIYFYPMSVGRSTDELLRMVTALERTSADNVMTPANWKAGDDVMVPTIPRADASKDELANEGIYNLNWFMWYKKAQ